MNNVRAERESTPEELIMQTLSAQLTYCVNDTWYVATVEGAKIGNLVVWRVQIGRVLNDLVIPVGTKIITN